MQYLREALMYCRSALAMARAQIDNPQPEDVAELLEIIDNADNVADLAVDRFDDDQEAAVETN